MPTNYVVRLLSANPAGTASLIIPGAPDLATTYGPARHTSAWVGQTIAGSLTPIEQSVSFSDPDGNGHISNTSPITFRVRPEHRWYVSHVGLFPLSCLGAQRSDSLLNVSPLAVIAWPSGPRFLAEPNSPLDVDAGALVFTP